MPAKAKKRKKQAQYPQEKCLQKRKSAKSSHNTSQKSACRSEKVQKAGTVSSRKVPAKVKKRKKQSQYFSEKC